MTHVLGADDKRIHIFHALAHAPSGDLLATAEHMLLHVDARASRACPMLEPLASRVRRIAEAQSALSPPEGAGSSIRLPAR
jgi:carnitine 3-dehydrogenase